MIDRLREVALALPDTTEDVKWGNDLVFSVLGKMFAVVCLEPPHTVSFKCSPEDQAELVEQEGIIPAPYLARYFWVQLAEPSVLGWRELEQRLRVSHELVRAKVGKGSPGRSAIAQATKKATKVTKKATRVAKKVGKGRPVRT